MILVLLGVFSLIEVSFVRLLCKNHAVQPSLLFSQSSGSTGTAGRRFWRGHCEFTLGFQSLARWLYLTEQGWYKTIFLKTAVLLAIAGAKASCVSQIACIGTINDVLHAKQHCWLNCKSFAKMLLARSFVVPLGIFLMAAATGLGNSSSRYYSLVKEGYLMGNAVLAEDMVQIEAECFLKCNNHALCKAVNIFNRE